MKKQSDLKTLKNCEIEWITDGSLEQEPYVRYSSLMAEAIKWVKYHKSQYDKIPSGCAWNDSLSAKISWIGHFFNLSEEDLK